MGFRTVVMLNNDRARDWENDPELGKKIAMAMNHIASNKDRDMVGNYGRVVECTHADTVTLAVMDFYTGFSVLSYDVNRKQVDDAAKVRMLKDAADQLGYRLVRKSSPKT